MFILLKCQRCAKANKLTETRCCARQSNVQNINILLQTDIPLHVHIQVLRKVPWQLNNNKNRSKHSLPSFKPHTRTVPTKGFDYSPVILTASGKMNKLCVVWKLIHIGEVRLNFISLLCTNIPMFAIKRLLQFIEYKMYFYVYSSIQDAYMNTLG